MSKPKTSSESGKDHYKQNEPAPVLPSTQPPRDRPSSQELTMFSPYNSMKNFEAPSSRELGESVSLPEKSEPKVGTARVFFNKIFSGNQFTQSAASAPPKKPTSQKSSTPTASSPRAISPNKGQSSGKPMAEAESKKILVRPARGGLASPQKQTPQMSRDTNKKSPPNQPAGPSRALPPNQPKQEVAKWSSSRDAVSLSGTESLSLSSYAHPRQIAPPASHAGQPSSKGEGRSGTERPGQTSRRTELLTRFGQIESDQSGTDLRKYWMPDNACKDCSDCGVKFTLFTRRHHCRICGRIYCNTCCSLTIPANKLRDNLQGNLRVCKECGNIFREHLRKPKQDSSFLNSESQGSDSNPLSPRLSVTLTPVKGQVTSGDPPPIMPSPGGDGAVLKTGSGTYSRVLATSRPTSILSPHKSWDDASGRSQELDMSPSRLGEYDMYHTLRRRGGPPGLMGFDSLAAGQRDDTLLDLDEDELEAIVTGVWFKLLDPEIGLPRQNHRYRLRTFPNTYNAHQLVEWLVINEHVRSREAAIRVGQALVNTKRLKIVSTVDSYFRDDANMFLELGEAAELLHDYSESPLLTDAPKWFLRLKDNEEADENEVQDDPACVTKDFIHVPPSNARHSTSSEKGLVVSSVTLKEAENRKSRAISYSSLGRGEFVSENEYLVIDSEQRMSNKQDPPYIPSQATPPNQHTFSVIGNEEFVQSISVEGLSAATEAAKEYADNKSKLAIPRDKALSHYEQVHNRHFDALMIQMMKNFGLNLKWLPVIRPLIMEASRNVRTDVFTEDVMDINQYVKIKKIPRGQKNNSTLVYGVVCTKNVTHKKMLKSIKNPKILLLRCAFEFQRKENQLSSFDTLQLQEREYLKNLVVKVNTIKPNLILVQKSVSRLALEMLFDLGVAVAVNVKPSVMNRVARSTKGEVLHSLDQLMFGTSSIFGTCGHFYIRNFLLPDGITKTLMYFDHCPPELGCVITLQGAPLKELKKVKKVTQFGLHIAYNSILETHFLVDEFAWPSEEKDHETPSEDYSSTCSTPEWPLYPSLGYPLDSLSQGELTKKLEALKFVQIEEGNLEESDQSQEAVATVPVEGLVEASMKDEVEAAKTDKEVVCVLDLEPSESDTGLDKSLPTVEEGDEEDVEARPPSESGHASLESGEIQLIEESVARKSSDEVSIEEEPGLLMKVEEVPLTPVQALCKKLNDKVLHKFAEEEFKLAHQNHILSVSPYIRFQIPYLQTPLGRSADARQYLPSVIYWSYLFRPKNLLRNSQKLCSKSVAGSATPLEMGITKSTVQSSVGIKSGQSSSSENGNLTMDWVPTHPSYKSVSSHPFTSSIFLSQADTNEMRAALADFRSRAGYQDEDSTFLFKSAKKASNYHMYLSNLFSSCREFEEAAAALEEMPAVSEKEASMATSGGSVVKAKKSFWEKKSREKDGRRKVRDLVKRLMTGRARKKAPTVNESTKVQNGGVIEEDNSVVSKDSTVVSKDDTAVSKDNTIVSKDDTVVSEDIDSVSSRTLDVSTDDEDSAQYEDSSTSESGSEGELEKITPSRIGNGPKNRDSGGGMKLGTLDDFDRKQSSKAKVEEDMGDSNYEIWLAADEQVDCFDPVNHQGISILFSNTAHDGLKHQVPCVAPCVIPMFYYGRNDISLGEFLHRYCFRPYYRCQTCGSEMIHHQRHVIHALSAVHISMQQLVSPLPGNDGGVYTWLACKYCDQCTPYTLMSRDSLLFSFAKFIELKFYCETYVTRHYVDESSSCKHSLHKDYVQYFLHKDKIAAFQPDIVGLLEVLVPPRTISITTPREKYHLDFKVEIKLIQRIIEGVFYRVGQKLERYRLDPVAHSIDDHIANSKAERDALRSKVKQLKDLVVSGCPLISEEAEKKKANMNYLQEAEIVQNLQDNVADLKRCVSDVVDCWNIHLEDLDGRVREYRRKIRERDSTQGELPRDNSANTQTTPSQSLITASEQSRGSSSHTPYDTPPESSGSMDLSHPSLSSSNLLIVSREERQTSCPPSPSQDATRKHSRNLSDSGLLNSRENKAHERNLSDSGHLQPASNLLSAQTTPLSDSDAGLGSTDALTIPSTAPSLGELSEEGGVPYGEQGYTAVESLESGTPEGEIPSKPASPSETVPATKKEEAGSSGLGQRSDVPSSDGNKSSVPKQSSDIVKAMGKDDKDDDTQTDSSGGLLARFRGKDPQEIRDDPTRFYLLDPYLITTTGSPLLGKAHQAASHTTSPISDTQQKSGKKLSVAQKKSSMARDASVESHSEGSKGSEKRKEKEKTGVLSRPFQRLPPPFPNSEHHTMHSIVTIPIGIYEQEPTSIIAFALSSREYKRKLTVLEERSAKMGGASTKVIEVNPAQTSSSPKTMRRQISEAEKAPPPGANATTLKTNFKAVLNEIKKKSSAISLFSGSTTISVHQASPEVFDPPLDPASRRSEFTNSYAGKSYDPSIQPPRSGDPFLEGVGSANGVNGLEELDSSKATPHISLEFTSPDKSAGFFCKVYYAEEFRKLRELIFPSGEECFIRSLSRCVKYDAKGGKSRSAFCKVADDRFILKQVKSIEISSFELFAPHYLKHVTKALEEKRPLTLAKILGAYSIGFRNSKSGSSKRLDVLVMENLLYGHTTNKVFDLKGSMRSRYVDPSKESSGDVLLDENYLNSICCNPVYVHPHSKCVLMQAILTDSEFLAQNAIMDYSLLTCIDESTGELVVGIIDYIRTFTLDKRLEMYLKKTAGKVLPTVVYPELYRKRFCDAMDRYFTVVPDKWTGLGADLKFF